MEETLHSSTPVSTSLSDKIRTRLASSSRFVSMLTFIGRRLIFGVFVLVGIIYLTFLGFGIIQGFDFLGAAGEAGMQTLGYLGRLSQGDLGTSVRGTLLFRSVPVIELLPQVASRSLGLLGVTFLISIVVGVFLGSLAAIFRRSLASLVVIITSIIGISTPSFFAALFLQIAAIELTRNLGRMVVPVGGFGWDKHLVLPVLVLAARPVAQITRITFVALSEIYEQDYVRTAHSKGLREDHIFLVHISRNALIPILTTIALSLRFALSSLPVVEIYFSWGGIGQTLLASLFNQDINTSIAMFLVLGVVFILINTFLEIGYSLIDPRLRANGTSAMRSERESLVGFLGSFLLDLGSSLVDNPLIRWLKARRQPPDISKSKFPEMLSEQDAGELEAAAHLHEGRWRAWRRGLLGNIPLMFGLLIVVGLVILTIFGPRLAPLSPNTVQQIAVIDGVITIPPFAPSALHPWGTDPMGRDMLSLILAGAQQTMILAVSVVVVRMLVGFGLGALAGWFPDSWLDRFITGLNQAIAVYPTLLLGALLIFMIGIEDGMRTFVIALSLVGWGEVMQFVRSEMINIRPKPFIESAVAVGQRSHRLILMHVLPNLAPALISVAALETGAVLLILGELGFLGIFIRGGAGTDYGLYSQVPEWGALLGGVRTWTRAYPWTGFYPTTAFFIAILGFNLLGEGIRRFFREVGMVLKKLISPYTIGLLALAGLGFVWAQQNTGELAFFRLQAETFSAEAAYQHVGNLSSPLFSGRAVNAPELDLAAEYIARNFAQLGLQRGGEGLSYNQTTVRRFQRLDMAELHIDGVEEKPIYLEDFSVYPSETQNLGRAAGPVRLLAWQDVTRLQQLDFSENIILLLDKGALTELYNHRCQAVLVVADELNDLKRRYTYSAEPPQDGCGRATPVLWISERLAGRLLQSTGQSYNKLVETAAEEDILDIPLETTAQVVIDGSIEEKQVRNIIGQLPGTNQYFDHQLIVVAAQYDSPPIDPGGVYPGANDNASGVGVMLEVIRTLQESGYQPFKTFLFVAYSGEGLPDGRTAPEIESLLAARSTFQDAFEVEAVIYLRGLAGGQEDTLAIWTPEGTEISKMIETASHLTGQETNRVEGLADMNLYAAKTEKTWPETDFAQVGISRQGWERSARLSMDNLTFLKTADLGTAGEAVSLALMILGR